MVRWFVLLIKAKQKMSKEKYLSEQDLAKRWGFDPRTLQRWREENKGPAYINICGSIRYKQEAIDQFEQDNLKKKRSLKADSNQEVRHV